MNNKFKERMRELRKYIKLTQKNLAKQFDVSGNTISAWECGASEPDFNTLIKLAKYFGVTTDYLLGLEDV